MKRILLIRHGEQAQIMNNPQLSEGGIKQATITGRHLATKYPQGLASLYASDKNRAQHTASLIQQVLQERGIPVPIFTEPDLTEKKIKAENYRDTPTQFYADWTRSILEPDWAPVDGESDRDAGMRLDGRLQSLPETESELPHVLVSHGGIIAALLRSKFSFDEIDKLRPKFSDIGKVSGVKAIRHCSLTELVLEGQDYSLVGVDSISHLEREGLGEGNHRPVFERR